MRPIRVLHPFLLASIASVLAACSDGTPPAGSAATAQTADVPPTANATLPAVPGQPGASLVKLGSWNGVEPTGEGFDHCSIDAINGITAADGEFVVAAADPLTLEGWIAAPGPVDPGALVIYFKGPDNFQGDSRTGMSRDDVAAALQSPALGKAGFKASIAPSSLPAGDYTLFLSVTSEGAQQFCSHRYKLRVS
jgi:hypothetical protein